VKIAVVGMGLVGGSIARALAGAGHDVVGVDRAPVPDFPDRAQDDLGDREGVFVATPLAAMRAVLGDLAGFGGFVTDTAGVKGCVMEWARGLNFVGGHPMIGGKAGGFARARADLFVGAEVALCGDRVAPVDALWREMGALPRHMSAAEHDAQVGWSSHLPYLTALLLRAGLPEGALRGPGFAESTRYADFDPAVMAAVVGHNPAARAAARELARRLTELADRWDVMALAERTQHR
jgi:prephenate dehydrogenase